MKKSIIALSLMASYMLASAANAADGTINFTGSIISSACTVNTASASQTVNLGNVNSTAFGSTVGTTAAATQFSINLTNCPSSVTSASVKFDGTENATNSSILALSSGETATGVGVALYEADGSTVLPLQTASNSITIPTASSGTSSATLNFVAKYMSTASSVTAGTADATTEFTIVYN